MTQRVHTWGNDRPHIVAEGYIHRSRFDVPLTRDPDAPGLLGYVFAALLTSAVVGVAFLLAEWLA